MTPDLEQCQEQKMNDPKRSVEKKPQRNTKSKKKKKKKNKKARKPERFFQEKKRSDLLLPAILRHSSKYPFS